VRRSTARSPAHSLLALLLLTLTQAVLAFAEGVGEPEADERQAVAERLPCESVLFPGAESADGSDGGPDAAPAQGSIVLVELRSEGSAVAGPRSETLPFCRVVRRTRPTRAPPSLLRS
jgi:hypothetical protein